MIHITYIVTTWLCVNSIGGIGCAYLINQYLIQNSQAVKKVCGPQKGYGEKRCEIQGGGQEMAVMVG